MKASTAVFWRNAPSARTKVRRKSIPSAADPPNSGIEPSAGPSAETSWSSLSDSPSESRKANSLTQFDAALASWLRRRSTSPTDMSSANRARSRSTRSLVWKWLSGSPTATIAPSR